MNATTTVIGPRGRGRLATLFALGLLAAAASTAHAWTPVTRSNSVYQGPLQVSVTVNGGTTPLFQPANKMDRWYLQARKGGHYEVRVRNTSGERIAFVIAVDGINAINGVRSHLGADEPMYVLDPYQSTTVKGWRKDMGNVSRFVFVDEERSYAARTDQANGDLGWIRVAAFNEFRPRVWRQLEDERLGAIGGRGIDAPQAKAKGEVREETSRRSANGMGTDSYGYEPPPAAAPSPGTGWGSNQRDRVRSVEFTPERFACTQVVLRYEYQGGLVALGILPWRGGDRDRLWERENGTLGFAQPPRH
jgi:hypothetical protein